MHLKCFVFDPVHPQMLWLQPQRSEVHLKKTKKKTHTNRLCSTYSAFRCSPSNPCPHDCQYYRYTGRPGRGLHGNEVHQLWRRWQNTQVPHCHDWRYHHPGWRWEDLYFFFVFINFLCVLLFLFFCWISKKHCSSNSSSQLCVQSLPALGTLTTSSRLSTIPSPPSIQSEYESW